MRNPSFAMLPFHNDVALRFVDATAHAMNGASYKELTGGSWFVFVQQGTVIVNKVWPLHKGMYACLSHAELHSLTDTRAMIVHHKGVDAMFTIGGPIEDKGRLRYIDGCTDSLLIPPVKKGDPCLNYLHFPTNIRQTMHTHPSVRIGIVYEGKGLCVTPFGEVALLPGMMFAIVPENGQMALGVDGQPHTVGLHCFYTFRDEMKIVAFHPNSDYGPTDEVHPMINRTIVDGVSASHLTELHTRG